MWLFEIALGGLLIVSCILTFLAISRRIQKRRRTYVEFHAHADERDTLARFRRIMGRNPRE